MSGALRIAWLALSCGLFAIGCCMSHARADFVYDISVGNTWLGAGNIAFDSSSGNSIAGLTIFSFEVDAGIGSPQSYDLADVLTVEWSIDDSSNLSLLLITSLVPFGTGQSALLLSNQLTANPDPCGVSGALTVGSITCETLPSGDDGAHFQGTLSAHLVEIPEPATTMLFGGGLFGLAMMVRRRTEAQNVRR